MKKIILGFVLGAIVSVSGSAYAVNYHLVPIASMPAVKAFEAQKLLSNQEQIAKGYTFNRYTGERLVPEEIKGVSPMEKRLQDIEKRLEKLEKKNK